MRVLDELSLANGAALSAHSIWPRGLDSRRTLFWWSYVIETRGKNCTTVVADGTLGSADCRSRYHSSTDTVAQCPMVIHRFCFYIYPGKEIIMSQTSFVLINANSQPLLQESVETSHCFLPLLPFCFAAATERRMHWSHAPPKPQKRSRLFPFPSLTSGGTLRSRGIPLYEWTVCGRCCRRSLNPEGVNFSFSKTMTSFPTGAVT